MSYYRMCKSEIKASRAFLKGRLTEWIGYKQKGKKTFYYYITQNKAGFLRDLKKWAKKAKVKAYAIPKNLEKDFEIATQHNTLMGGVS